MVTLPVRSIASAAGAACSSGAAAALLQMRRARPPHSLLLRWPPPPPPPLPCMTGPPVSICDKIVGRVFRDGDTTDVASAAAELTSCSGARRRPVAIVAPPAGSDWRTGGHDADPARTRRAPEYVHRHYHPQVRRTEWVITAYCVTACVQSYSWTRLSSALQMIELHCITLNSIGTERPWMTTEKMKQHLSRFNVKSIAKWMWLNWSSEWLWYESMMRISGGSKIRAKDFHRYRRRQDQSYWGDG